MKRNKKTLTLREIATLAGTSKSTVSRVLTNHVSVSPAVRAQVEAVIRKHNYRPNIFARGLTGARSGLIAVISPWLESGFFASVIRGIDEVVTHTDGHLLTTFAHSDDDYYNVLVDYANGRQVDGIIAVAPPMAIFNNRAKLGDKPVVLCASRVDDPESDWNDLSSVTVDNADGMEQIMQYLYHNGCRKIIYVAGNNDVYDSRQREGAYLAFLERKKDVSGQIIRSRVYDNWGYYATVEYLEEHREETSPDAFVGFNDATAFGIIEAVQEKLSDQVEKIFVTGFDNETAAGIIGLTTVRMPMDKLGREAAHCLYEQIDSGDKDQTSSPRHRILPMELVIRDRYKTLMKYLPLNELYKLHTQGN
jgi:LacI family transcriptional regulator